MAHGRKCSSGSPGVGTRAGRGRRDRSGARECSRSNGGGTRIPAGSCIAGLPSGRGGARGTHRAARPGPLSARALAQSALDVYGPDAALFAVLGQGHAAEKEDDHDDRADEVYRRGLALFPDDVDLLAAHAELCLNSDPFDRPGRHRRGSVLTARLRELAPDSPQTARAEHVAANRAGPPRRPGARPPRDRKPGRAPHGHRDAASSRQSVRVASSLPRTVCA